MFKRISIYGSVVVLLFLMLPPITAFADDTEGIPDPPISTGVGDAPDTGQSEQPQPSTGNDNIDEEGLSEGVTTTVITGTVFGKPKASNTYSFVGDGKLKSQSGKVNEKLWKSILKAKEKSIISEMEAQARGKYTYLGLTGDLDTSNGDSFWQSSPEQLRGNDATMYLRVSQGSAMYYILVPKVTGSGTRQQIDWIIKAIEEYKMSVKQGVLAGSIKNSYNVYTMYPNNPVPLTDILEKDTTSANGDYKFKASAVKMNYAFDYFYNPIFGKIDATELVDTKTDTSSGIVAPKKGKTFWDEKLAELDLGYEDKNKISYTPTAGFLSFMNTNSQERETLSDLTTTLDLNVGGIRSYTTYYDKAKVSPKSLVDSSFYLTLPTKFNKSVDGDSYTIAKDGYKAIMDTKLLVSTSRVYMQNGKNEFERVGDFATYGISPENLVVYKVSVGGTEKAGDGTKIVGAVIPMQYREAINNTADGKAYITGRNIVLANDYSGKLKLDDSNKDLFATQTKLGGKTGELVRNFAFKTGSDVRASNGHGAVSGTPQDFEFKMDFKRSGSGSSGFLMYRNNSHLNDKGLMTWLESSEAKAMTDVNADKLKALLDGSFELEADPLTYDEWLRVQEVRTEMDGTFQSFFRKAIRVVTLIFGVFLIVYSVFLGLAYWFDVLNPFTQTSVLSLITMGKMYPVASNEDREYAKGIRGDSVIYASFPYLVVVMLVCMLVGAIFMFGTPIIEFIVWVYYKISTWVGGI